MIEIFLYFGFIYVYLKLDCWNFISEELKDEINIFSKIMFFLILFIVDNMCNIFFLCELVIKFIVVLYKRCFFIILFMLIEICCLIFYYVVVIVVFIYLNLIEIFDFV